MRSASAFAKINLALVVGARRDGKHDVATVLQLIDLHDTIGIEAANALVVEGLRTSGHPELARALAERTVALVVHGGGPHEYFNPETGRKARTATTAFGWSAALFIDLAVGLTP